MDWINFFEINRIHYATSGPNCSKGNLITHCVWCGQSDESQHLVVNLEGKGFKCWRDRSHAGKNPAKLIQALLGCSWDQANQLAGQAKSLPNDFMAKVKQSLMKQEVECKPNNLKWPVDFKPFSTLPSCKPYWAYIRSRGFILRDAYRYNVLYASQGLYRGRIIFPVVVNDILVGWTGRTIYPTETLRYKTLTNDRDKAEDFNEIPAPAPISNFLLFYDRLKDADTIVLTEGPFDAWRVNVLGEQMGCVATCFFTSTISKAQLNLLHELLPRFKNKFLLLDQNTFSKTARMKADLSSLGVVVKRLPNGVKDPALLSSTKELQDCLK